MEIPACLSNMGETKEQWLCPLGGPTQRPDGSLPPSRGVESMSVLRGPDPGGGKTQEWGLIACEDFSTMSIFF